MPQMTNHHAVKAALDFHCRFQGLGRLKYHMGFMAKFTWYMQNRILLQDDKRISARDAGLCIGAHTQIAVKVGAGEDNDKRFCGKVLAKPAGRVSTAQCVQRNHRIGLLSRLQWPGILYNRFEIVLKQRLPSMRRAPVAVIGIGQIGRHNRNNRQGMGH